MKKTVGFVDLENSKNQGKSFAEMNWQDEAEDPNTKIFIGQVPIMLKSSYCILGGLRDQDLHEISEFLYNQVSKKFEKYFFFL